MKLHRAILFTLLAGIGIHSTSYAQYPDRQVTIIVPQTPGGASDTLARIFSQKLSEKWKQSVVVDNRPGAGGNIGVSLAARAPADGYTLLMSYEGTHAINVSVYRDLSYDPVNDFIPVATIATVPFVCIVNNDVKAATFDEFVALARSKPGMTYGSAGNGSVNHLLGEMLNLVADTQLTHVPYRGAGAAITDLLGKRIDAVFTSYASISQQVEAGKVRALASTSAARPAQLAELPTIAESGYPSFDVNPWFGLFAPKGTSSEIVQRINADIAELLSNEETIKAIALQGAAPLKSTPEEFKQMLESDIQKWAKVVERSGARID